MGITVADIEQKEFTFKGAGYDPYDVDSYLDQICDEMIAMQDRIDALETELKQAKASLEMSAQAVKPIPQEVAKADAPAPISKTSETLENILLSAQRISDEAIDSAKKRADEIIGEAQDKASELLDNAQEEKVTIEKELKSLRMAASDYKKRFLNLMNEHKAMLESESTIFEEEGDAPKDEPLAPAKAPAAKPEEKKPAAKKG